MRRRRDRRRQERLARRNDRSSLASLGVSVPGGFATTAQAYRDFLVQGGLDARIREALAARSTSMTSRSSRRPARRSASGSWPRLSRRARQRECGEPARMMRRGERDRGGGALLRHRRGSAGGLVRRPAGNLPQRARRRQRAHGDARSVRLAVQRSRHRLSRAPGLRSQRGRAVRGVQHMVRSDLGASGVMFTLDTDSGFRDVVFITASYGLGETVVQGAVNPDEFYVYKPALRAGSALDPAPQPRRQGDQDDLRRGRLRRARRHRRRAAGRPRALLASTTTTSRRSRARRCSSRSTTAARWTSNGARTAPPARSTSCRRGRRRCRAAPAAPSSASR